MERYYSSYSEEAKKFAWFLWEQPKFRSSFLNYLKSTKRITKNPKKELVIYVSGLCNNQEILKKVKDGTRSWHSSIQNNHAKKYYIEQYFYEKHPEVVDHTYDYT